MIKKQKILIVDDKKENLTALRQVLRAVDAEIVEANSGNEALAATLHHDFSLALLDVQMPLMSGFELARHLRAESGTLVLPIVFLTASYQDEAQVLKGYDAGGVDYITKPYQPEALLAKVRIFLEMDGNRRELELYRERLETQVDERTYELNKETAEHRRTETARASAEARYSELFSRMTEGFALHELICDKAGKPVDYRFLEVNQAYENFTGLRRDDILNRTALEVLPATEPRLIEAYGHVALTRKTIRLEDFAGVPGRFFSVTVFSPRPGQFVTILADVTERKKTEDELRGSEAKYRSLFTSSRDALMTLAPPLWRFTSGNPATLALFGAKTEEEFEACTPGDLSPALQPDGRSSAEKAAEMISKVLREGSCFFEWTHKRLNGTEFQATVLLTRCELNGAEFLQATVRDITEHKRTELTIHGAYEMQGVLNAMLQHSLAAVPLREKLSGHLAALFALPWLAVQPKGAVFILNARRDALVMMAQQGLASHLLEACALVPLGRCLCGKAAGTGQVVESASVGADHETAYAGMEPHGHFCSPITADGQTLGVLNLYLKKGAALTDPQKRFVKHAANIMAENILHAQTEEKLLQAQKMESVGRLAGGVAHDFNNILSVIKCYGEFVRKALPPQDPRAEDVQEILTAADRAVALTRQLLAFSRRQIMTPKAADLNKCVSDMTNMLRRLIGEDISLTTGLARTACTVMLDTGQMEQVLVNLVVNARDAMPGGGKIELSTELLPASEELFLAHPELARGPLVCFRVKDNGSGMTPEVKSHLFEPFYTTKEQGKGTGLGLSTVFGIVKQSGGDIEVESEPGKGTTFRICFPYYQAAPAAVPQEADEPAKNYAKGGETVLLVEDEESLRRLGRRVLASNGYTVLAAGGGEEALKELERYGKPVDLLVTDVVMPGMSGRELGREVARRELAGRILYMSGYTDDAIVKHGVLEPGLAFIYKPFTVDGLLAKVRAVLDGPREEAKA